MLRLNGGAEAHIRGCEAFNVTVDPDIAEPRLGIVNSTFDPPLARSIRSIRPPLCGASVAGERLCDPRAVCNTSPSGGGVLCTCVGTGLQDRPGYFPDGRQCQQATQVDLRMQSKTVVITVRKPGDYGEKLLVTLRAEGESAFNASFSLSMTHVRAASGGELTAIGNATWPSMHGRRQSLHGHHLIWDASPSDDAQVDLDADVERFSAAKQYSVQLRLDCDHAQPCIADGDSVETVLTLGSALDPSGLRSTVRIRTEVESLLSCQSSTAWIEHELRSVPASGSLVDAVPISTPILVHLLAKDVDDLNVNLTRAEIYVQFDGRSVPMQWSRGSHEYVAVYRTAWALRSCGECPQCVERNRRASDELRAAAPRGAHRCDRGDDGRRV